MDWQRIDEMVEKRFTDLISNADLDTKKEVLRMTLERRADSLSESEEDFWFGFDIGVVEALTRLRESG